MAMLPGRGNAEQVLIDGAAGRIQVVIDEPQVSPPRGIALVAHPHPLFGGALDNKVAQTLAQIAHSSVSAKSRQRAQ